MAQQSKHPSASVTWFSPEPERVDTAPCEYQPKGVDEEEKEEPEGEPSF
tara:strand:+ start:138 stop:284 length:147 start_codon:yes stop_codon:yes gene_type:complete